MQHWPLADTDKAEGGRECDREASAKTTTVKSRIGLKKNCFRRKWETKAKTWSPRGRFKEPLHLRRWNIKKKKNGKGTPKKEKLYNKVKEWQRETIVPPCHPRTYIRNINLVMRMTYWMTRGLFKTLKGVKKKKKKTRRHLSWGEASL